MQLSRIDLERCFDYVSSKQEGEQWTGIKLLATAGDYQNIIYKYGKVEFGEEEYDQIDSYCYQQGIAWSASPWDLDSVEFLKQYELPFVKLPSAMLTEDTLLDSCVKHFPKVIFSTGMSTQDEIDHAVEILRSAQKRYNKTQPIGLLHCNSTYPAPIEQLNLSGIKTLAERYPDFEIGYSGHESGLQISVAAVAMGAKIIERHITLDRTMWGSDQAASVEPEGLRKLVRDIRVVESALGDGKKVIYESEKSSREKLRRFK